MAALLPWLESRPQYPPTCSKAPNASGKNAQVLYFERIGHYPFIEGCEAFYQTAGDFLVE
jgi:hypothetical protein